MKKLTTVLIAVAMMLTFTTPTFADVDWSPNLLVNPGAEEGDTSGWKRWSGSFGNTPSSGSTLPYKGNYFFYLYGNGTAKISQNIDVSNYTSDIDNGATRLA